MQGHHLNDIPSDNRLINLQWGTPRENAVRAIQNGRFVAAGVRGERHHQAKLSEDQVREIRRRHAAGESAMSLARWFRMSDTTIGRIVMRRIWSHIDGVACGVPVPTPVEAAMIWIVDWLRSASGLVGQTALYIEFRGVSSGGRGTFRNAIDKLERTGQIVVVRPGDDDYYRAYWVGYLGSPNWSFAGMVFSD
jgi:hypothetical protein